MKLLSRKKSVGYVCLGQTGFNCVEDQHSILLHHTIEIGPVGHVHQLLAARQEGRAGRENASPSDGYARPEYAGDLLPPVLTWWSSGGRPLPATAASPYRRY